MATMAEKLTGEALWLEPGKPIISMSLQSAQVRVNNEALHGFYATHQHADFHWQCLQLCFSHRQNPGERFEDQVPYNMRPYGTHVYRNYNKQQMFVSLHQEPELPCSSVRCANRDFSVVSEYVYCHPSKPEESLLLGWFEGEQKVSFKGKEPTGKWGFHDWPSASPVPSGIDGRREILTVTFHCNGEADKEITTLYGMLTGTTDVYRAIGWNNSAGVARIYVDAEMSFLSDWHIVLVSVAGNSEVSFK